MQFTTIVAIERARRIKERAALGIEPRTSRTLSENHTTRPSSHNQAFSSIAPNCKQEFGWRALGEKIIGGRSGAKEPTEWLVCTFVRCIFMPVLVRFSSLETLLGQVEFYTLALKILKQIVFIVIVPNQAKHLVNDFASHIACRNPSKLNKHARDYSIEFKKSDFIEFIQKSNQTERKPRKKTTIGRKKFNSAVQNTTGTWKEKSEENPEVQRKFWNHLNSRKKQSKVTRNHWNPPEIRRKFSRAARGVRKTWKIWKCIQCK